uniref:LAGLIDADG endonuclease n=1 Tax=Spizellomyces sp. 'palustris' TaxID=117820 RepID=UPI0010FC2CE7|nr:LAGLIDADG endonuclease [Spizellomyces sp. 'palustris']QCQ69037.1 LAGLIDADG endonuclease [Spizellomyces sp. 'palustris']
MWFHNLVASLGYCKLNKPTLERRIGVNGKIRYFYRVRTFCFSSFNWIHDLFYPDGSTKVVPTNIADYLTPMALAIWLMDDGTSHSSGLRFCTHGFTKADVEFLGQILWDKYGIRTSLHRHKPDMDQYYLYIRADSMQLLSIIVKPYLYLHPSMHWKLGRY